MCGSVSEATNEVVRRCGGILGADSGENMKTEGFVLRYMIIGLFLTREMVLGGWRIDLGNRR